MSSNQSKSTSVIPEADVPARQLMAELKADVVKELHQSITESTRTARQGRLAAAATLRELAERKQEVLEIERRAQVALQDAEIARTEANRSTRILGVTTLGLTGLNVLAWVAHKVTNSHGSAAAAMLP